MRRQIPKHFKCTQREFKQQKRAQLKAAQSAILNMRFGCAYTPAFQLILDADELLLRIADSLSVKKWGR